MNQVLTWNQVFQTLSEGRLTPEIETFLLITSLSFIPFFLIAATTFTRNIIVFSFLRSALGLQQTPPNMVLLTLAMFLTIFTMEPIFLKSFDSGISPYLKEEISFDIAIEKSWKPFQNFMIKQTNESDIQLIYKLSEKKLPSIATDVPAVQLIPAFLLSELRTAFKIGFIIYLPFLLIDFVISALLMSLGMIMVPPITISLPLKIMLFVVVDGWSLIAETLIHSVSG
ncbi:flagellar type III secretion system pore protein FliP [Teredinibacter sp. KSP-S5-2]|uniref:flagellar type III secretion system pore protein FliP n=1 Tax=Teredinibacter sp. KSP-S5-2 TaxID=3034506 RepID=UPI0029341D1D|nr:flagellar type III secretion system pore protein FliP [Teredinibacter sp. KSP-S5-2]WNO11329.1 flagellar type III secretion system pore protein FliP [Teredinibacter sp. KSP-S5-2]